MNRLSFFAVLAPLGFLLAGCSQWRVASPPPLPSGNGSARSLFGATGWRLSRYGAVAVVEIDSRERDSNVKVSAFEFLDERGRTLAMDVVSVEEFDRPPVDGWGEFAYYLNGAVLAPPGDRTRPWDGVLPAGKIRLRVRGSLPNSSSKIPHQVHKYRLTVGSYSITGECDAEWPN